MDCKLETNMRIKCFGDKWEIVVGGVQQPEYRTEGTLEEAIGKLVEQVCRDVWADKLNELADDNERLAGELRAAMLKEDEHCAPIDRAMPRKERR